VVPLEQGRKVLLVTFDVTEQADQRRQFEELARREESGRLRLKAILETIPVGILVLDQHGRVDMTNEMRTEIWGGRAPVTDMRGLSGTHGFWSETGLPVASNEWPLYRAWKEGLITLGAMIDIKRADGSMGTILGSAAPVRDQDCKIIGAVGILQDISRQRRLEQDAIEAKLKMELYLDVLAHDVNNLNAAAGGYLQLYLDREKTTAAGRRYLENIGAMLRDISSLIDSINKLQTLELIGGTRSLTDLAVVLEESVISMEKTSGRDVRIEFHPVLRTLVMGNELLKDLFDNLIGNAVKHCPEPVRIKVVVGKMLIEAREFYRVEIEDNGPGIPDEMKAKLFNRFQRGSSKAHGRGLGLYLVKKIAEDFGGKVWVEDRVEGDWTKGARFVVCLPVAQVPRSDLASQP
jgi:PAS domain S-box-containing protein